MRIIFVPIGITGQSGVANAAILSSLTSFGLAVKTK